MSHCVPNWGVESPPLPTHKPPPGAAHAVGLVPWLDGRVGGDKAVVVAATVRDAVVPCAVFGEDEVEGVQVAAPDSEGGCTRVGSCSGPAAWEFSRADDDEGSVNADDARVPVAAEEWSSEQGSASLNVSDTCDSIRRVPTMSSRESRERELSLSESLTTSFFSLGNTFSSSWGSDTNDTTPSDDNSSSSVFRSRKQRKETDTRERSNKRGTSRSSSTKRSGCKRADQSQRKRRGKIDQRRKDKEWVLDEVIEQVKQLQAQLHHHQHQMMMMMMMMSMPVMSMSHQLPHMPMMMQEGYRRQNLAALPPCVFPGVYMPTTAYPQFPMEELAHSRMAAASLMQHQQFPLTFQHGNFF